MLCQDKSPQAYPGEGEEFCHSELEEKERSLFTLAKAKNLESLRGDSARIMDCNRGNQSKQNMRA